MDSTNINQQTKNRLLKFQKNEITEHIIYSKLSNSEKKPNNKKVLKQISDDELRHYNIWKAYTNEDVNPSKLKIWKYYLISKVLGLTFGIKLMEKGEQQAQLTYDSISKIIPIAKKIEKEENQHEKKLISLIDEEKLRYVGSMVLGLNDALVELTGALAGFTFALQKPGLIALAGLITGIAASFSMAASEYLSTKSEKTTKSPLKSSIYTGFAYVLTVLFLIFPYFLFKTVYYSLTLTLINAILVILFFTFYTSVAQDLPFKRRFIEMAFISLGVAALTFGIGFLIRLFLGIEV